MAASSVFRKVDAKVSSWVVKWVAAMAPLSVEMRDVLMAALKVFAMVEM